MKQLGTVLLVFILIFTLVACERDAVINTQAPTQTPTEDTQKQEEVIAPEPEGDDQDPYVKMLKSQSYYASAGENSEFVYILYTSSRDDTGYVIIKEYKGTEEDVTVPDMLDGFPVIGMYHSIFDNTPFVSQIQFPESLRTVIFNTRADSDGCMVGTVWYQQQPDGVYYAGNVAVGCKGSGEVTLREGTVGVGGYAFRGREDLTTIELPASLLMLSDDAFSGSGLTEITIPVTLQYYFGAFGSCNDLQRVVFQEGITEICGTVSGSAVSEVVLPESLRVIGDSAFMRCENLQSITLPANVESIGDQAFYGSGLADIALNEGLESIGKEAFQHCKQLKCMYLPASVKYLDIRAVGFNIDDEPAEDFVAYFPEESSVMENLEKTGVTCKIGTRADA